MRRRGVPLAAIAVSAASVGLGCTGDDPEDIRGAELFANNCAVCHGPEGEGTATGPPLVHELYVPAETTDDEFAVAVDEGASRQHWDFGDMPPVSGLTDDEVTAITEHVRALQREAGVID